MKQLSLAAIAIGLCANALAQSVTVTIPANNPNDATCPISYLENADSVICHLWTNTGITVTQGQTITINANGFWNYGMGPLIVDGDDLNDNYDMFFGNYIHGGLIGYIGSNPTQNHYPGNSDSCVFFPQSSGYWQIGACSQYVCPIGGMLWLGMNDDANTGSSGDNSGEVQATVFFGYGATNSSADADRPDLSAAEIRNNTFYFSIDYSRHSIWAVYASSDLINWSLMDAVNLDGTGGASSMSQGISGYDNHIFHNPIGVPYRFYKLCNGSSSSRVIGFTRMTVPSNSLSAIANQVDNLGGGTYNRQSGNSLNALFNPMPDGSVLPANTQIYKMNSGQTFDIYTWNNGSWSPNGNATLNPGEAVFVRSPSNSPVYLTFAGLVEEGTLSYSLVSGWNLMSPKAPQAGPIATVLGYTPVTDDDFIFWDVANQEWRDYIFWSGRWLDTDSNVFSSTSPVISVGQGVYVYKYAATNWTREFKATITQ
jgi:hypothetical protein